MLKNLSIEKYNRYKNIISYKPNIDIFYNNGIFIREVRFEDGTFYLELNDNNNRYNKFVENKIDVNIQIHVDWLGEDLNVLSRSSGSAIVDYKDVSRVSYTPKSKTIGVYALLEVHFDECLMYNNIIQLNEYELI